MTSVHCRGRGGFSLLEMMIVVGVSALLIAIAVPAISGYQRTTRLTGAADVLASDLRLARSVARTQRVTVQVSFDSTGYTLSRVTPPARIRTHVLPRGVGCTGASAAIFYPWGLASGATLTLSDSRHACVVRLLANGSVSRD